MKTAVIEGRVDARDLATCADYFIKQGMAPTSKSDLMFKVLTTFAHASYQQGAKQFNTTEEAIGFLFNSGLGSVNRMIDKKKNKRANEWTLSQALLEEGKSGEFADLAQAALASMSSADIDSDIDPAIRAQHTAAKDKEQADRMAEFVASLKK
jgi:hypothetical protein